MALVSRKILAKRVAAAVALRFAQCSCRIFANGIHCPQTIHFISK